MYFPVDLNVNLRDDSLDCKKIKFNASPTPGAEEGFPFHVRLTTSLQASEFSSGVNMDKFVIRKRREDAVEKSSEKTEKVLKQATIDSLKVFYKII